MKIYYDKSAIGDVVFYSAVLIFMIAYCGFDYWLSVLILMGWIPILLMAISIFKRRKCYLKRVNNSIIFFKEESFKPLRICLIPIADIINYNIEDQKLTITTKYSSYVIDDFYAKKTKLDKLIKKQF